jgi:RNA polymerase sigma-70 factor (sigma-E family)
MRLEEDRAAGASTANEAIGLLFRTRGTRIVRLAYMLTGNAAAAEELAQEAFIATWRAWTRLRTQEAALAYVRSSVVNLSRSALRRKAVELRHRVTRVDSAVEVDVPVRVDVLRAVSALPKRQRECVALRFFEDLTEVETAEVLGISVGTVKSQTWKALRRLELEMGGGHED